MKTKKNGKKLELSKITIAKLNNEEMRMVRTGLGSLILFCMGTNATSCCPLADTASVLTVLQRVFEWKHT